MTEQQPRPLGQPSTDLEYDLAHEASAAPMRDAVSEPHGEAVPTATPAYDGDYSYDLAHDVPGR